MLDYDKIGLKCGIEIHQRLETGRKLFCHCSSHLTEEPSIIELKRQLRPVAGETGEIDPAALYELLRDRTFTYELFKDESCMIDADAEPPAPMDPAALKTTLTIAKMLKMDVPDELHVMRKTVVDGSNTGGFQRTTVVGVGNDQSVVETSEGFVRVKDLELEEESAGIVAPAVYRLDRLGIPLVEIGTQPDIKSPKQAYEAAMKIGGMLRLTSVQRGLGTIRQDINVSIKGGARVEVKGLQDIAILSDLIEFECQRQLALLEIKKLVKGKKFDDKLVDVTEIFSESKNKILLREIKKGGKVFAGTLPFKGLMTKTVCEGKEVKKTFGKELAEYAMAYGLKGIMHTEENLDKYGLKKEFAQIPLKGEVTFIVAGNTAESAARAVIERAKYTLKGVPEETRVAKADGTTAYARPLPGKERMYPETDVAPVRVTKELFDSIKLPRSVGKRREFLKALNLPKGWAEQLVLHEKYLLFENAVKSADAKLVATILLELIPYMRRDGKAVDTISDDTWLELFKAAKGMSKESLEAVILEVIKGVSPKAAIKTLSAGKLSKKEVEAEIEKLLKEKADFVKAQGPRALGGLMGEATKRLSGKADGALIAKILREKLKV